MVLRIHSKTSESIWAFSARLNFSQASRSPGKKAQRQVKWVRERVAFSRVDPISLVELLQSLRTDLPQRLLHLVFQRCRLDATRF
jgi:hypothetical protein